MEQTLETLSYSDYEYLLKIHKIVPNFFISEAYFEHAGLEIERAYARVKVYNPATQNHNRILMFPPLIMGNGLDPECKEPIEIDFEGYENNCLTRHRFDREYLYQPASFQDLSGRRWHTFKKNCKKVAQLNPKYDRPTNSSRGYYTDILLNILQDWAGSREIQDNETLINYVLYHDLTSIKCLFINNKIVGFNIWDRNYSYINYRFCIDNREVPFANEYLRLCFYTDKEIQTGVPVNDGGDLGDEQLFRFKNKLNPAIVRIRWSWENEEVV